MSHSFRLHTPDHTLIADAARLGITPSLLRCIDITVTATIITRPQPILQLTYDIRLPNIQLAARLCWPQWQAGQVAFTDYLWQKTCLECFIAPHHGTEYVELNASPCGQYALYQFTDYRTPSLMPPTPLLTTDQSKPAHLCWGKDQTVEPLTYQGLLNLHNTQHLNKERLAEQVFSPCSHYHRQLSVALEQLPSAVFGSAPQTAIGWIHPCVILWFGDVDLYFAPAHAAPPDFHQRRYWLRAGCALTTET